MANVFTNAGRAIVTNLVSGLGGTVPKFVGWGTGTTAAAATDTGLQTPSAEARTSGTVTRITTTVANDTMQVVGLITSASGQTISEAALFDALTVGNIFVHSVFTGLALLTNDAIQFTYQWQQT